MEALPSVGGRVLGGWKCLGLAFFMAASVQGARAQTEPRPIPMGVSVSTTDGIPGGALNFAGTAGLLVRSFFQPRSQVHSE